MCDDDFFDDDMDDGLCAPDSDNDIQEDLAGEDGERDEDSEDLNDELDAGNSFVTPDHFDLTEALVLGTMVGGIAYSEAIDEQCRSKLIKSENKPTK